MSEVHSESTEDLDKMTAPSPGPAKFKSRRDDTSRELPHRFGRTQPSAVLDERTSGRSGPGFVSVAEPQPLTDGRGSLIAAGVQTGPRPVDAPFA